MLKMFLLAKGAKRSPKAAGDLAMIFVFMPIFIVFLYLAVVCPIEFIVGGIKMISLGNCKVVGNLILEGAIGETVTLGIITFWLFNIKKPVLATVSSLVITAMIVTLIFSFGSAISGIMAILIGSHTLVMLIATIAIITKKAGRH